jgi:ATP-binding cassette subfamily F protein uup
VTQKKSEAKLSFKLQYELDKLPARIAVIENEIKQIEEAMDNPDLYETAPDQFNSYIRRIGHAKAELSAAEERWLELSAMKEALQ